MICVSRKISGLDTEREGLRSPVFKIHPTCSSHCRLEFVPSWGEFINVSELMKTKSDLETGDLTEKPVKFL